MAHSVRVGESLHRANPPAALMRPQERHLVRRGPVAGAFHLNGTEATTTNTTAAAGEDAQHVALSLHAAPDDPGSAPILGTECPRVGTPAGHPEGPKYRQDCLLDFRLAQGRRPVGSGSRHQHIPLSSPSSSTGSRALNSMWIEPALGDTSPGRIRQGPEPPIPQETEQVRPRFLDLGRDPGPIGAAGDRPQPGAQPLHQVGAHAPPPPGRVDGDVRDLQAAVSGQDEQVARQPARILGDDADGGAAPHQVVRDRGRVRPATAAGSRDRGTCRIIGATAEVSSCNDRLNWFVVQGGSGRSEGVPIQGDPPIEAGGWVGSHAGTPFTRRTRDAGWPGYPRYRAGCNRHPS